MPLPQHFPPRIAKLPRWRIMGEDYPVPFFVTWLDAKGEPCAPKQGTPDFRVADSTKWAQCVRHSKCWICGEPLGAFKVFPIGPMCAVNKVTSEPPCHNECAMFSVQVCPFLTRPRMKRNEKGIPDLAEDPAGYNIKRNPGVTCVWITKSFRVFRAPNMEGGSSHHLISIGEPTSVFWFAEGREATRAEVLASIDSGYPLLLDVAQNRTQAVLG